MGATLLASKVADAMIAQAFAKKRSLSEEKNAGHMTCVFFFLSQETKRQCFGIRNGGFCRMAKP